MVRALARWVTSHTLLYNHVSRVLPAHTYDIFPSQMYTHAVSSSRACQALHPAAA